jgi:hypothetical protein
MQVPLYIQTDYNCYNSIYSYINTTTQICAGKGDGKDTCQGDSGRIYIPNIRNIFIIPIPYILKYNLSLFF